MPDDGLELTEDKNQLPSLRKPISKIFRDTGLLIGVLVSPTVIGVNSEYPPVLMVIAGVIAAAFLKVAMTANDDVRFRNQVSGKEEIPGSVVMIRLEQMAKKIVKLKKTSD